MTWITGHLDCGHDFACACDELDDPRVLGAWKDIDQATKRGGREPATPPAPFPPRGHAGADTGAAHGFLPGRVSRPAPANADERAARARLYPVGDVIALPINNGSARPCPPDAA